jgi:hypothetical protein
MEIDRSKNEMLFKKFNFLEIYGRPQKQQKQSSRSLRSG